MFNNNLILFSKSQTPIFHYSPDDQAKRMYHKKFVCLRVYSKCPIKLIQRLKYYVILPKMRALLLAPLLVTGSVIAGSQAYSSKLTPGTSKRGVSSQ